MQWMHLKFFFQTSTIGILHILTILKVISYETKRKDSFHCQNKLRYINTIYLIQIHKTYSMD